MRNGNAPISLLDSDTCRPTRHSGRDTLAALVFASFNEWRRTAEHADATKVNWEYEPGLSRTPNSDALRIPRRPPPVALR